MSSFALEQSKKKWAEYEDSESDREEEGEQEAHDEEEEEDEEEEDDDEDQLDLSRIKSDSTSVKTEGKSKNKSLSKKELQQQKKKELEDLDSLLAQFKEDLPVPENPPNDLDEEKENGELAENNTETVAIGVQEENKTNKKKKKKKAQTERVSPSQVSTTITEPGELDVTLILKARTSKKLSTSSVKKQSDPLKIAMEEASKISSTKKKKRDKSKFNETSY